MPYVMVDVEADGPIPGDYSMISFGAVVVEDGLTRTFYGQLKPISDMWSAQALSVSGFTREDTLQFPDPEKTMQEFDTWLKEIKNPMFISDNNGFDWQFINYYFHHFLKHNPFGHSSTNLGSLYKGMVKDVYQNFKHLRKTKHTHYPVDDARGNCEALLHMVDKLGLQLTK